MFGLFRRQYERIPVSLYRGINPPDPVMTMLCERGIGNDPFGREEIRSRTLARSKVTLDSHVSDSPDLLTPVVEGQTDVETRDPPALSALASGYSRCDLIQAEAGGAMGHFEPKRSKISLP